MAGRYFEATVPHLDIVRRLLPPFPPPTLAAESGASSVVSGVHVLLAEQGVEALGVKVTLPDEFSSRKSN